MNKKHLDLSVFGKESDCSLSAFYRYLMESKPQSWFQSGNNWMNRPETVCSQKGNYACAASACSVWVRTGSEWRAILVRAAGWSVNEWEEELRWSPSHKVLFNAKSACCKKMKGIVHKTWKIKIQILLPAPVVTFTSSWLMLMLRWKFY